MKYTKEDIQKLSYPIENVKKVDPEIYDLIKQEEVREFEKIRMIPSENYASKAVMEAVGSVFMNKYSEGYPKKRYYEGQQMVDQVEIVARNRAKELFQAEHANVQPYSGSPANMAVCFSFLEPGDTMMGLHLSHGGHLTHGWNVNFTGRLYKSVQYTISEKTGRLDMDEIRDMAKKEKPKLIFAGATAYPRIIDFEAFGEIAREVGAKFVADTSHITGLIVGDVHPSPVPHADAVTTTTHKTLRGPRGGMILSKKTHRKAINKNVFPGLQGGPHDNTTAGIAVALKEASTPEFKEYAAQIVKNAKKLSEELLNYGYNLVTGGTDNHLILIDLSNKDVPGKIAAQSLDRAGIVLNYNSVPYDKRPPMDPSGIRMGTPSITSRGMKEDEMVQIAKWMNEAITNNDKEDVLDRICGEVKEFCYNYPAPGITV